MADTNNSIVNNGVNTTAEEFFDDAANLSPLKTPTASPAVDVDALNKRISDLEKENAESESRLSHLTSELEKLRAESKQSDAIAKRASDLENEVARLQNELISARNESSESTQLISNLNSEIAGLKSEKAEVEGRVKGMEAKMAELVKKSEESDELISGFMQKIEDRDFVTKNDDYDDDAAVFDDSKCDRLVKGLKENLGLLGAVSGGVFLAAGVMCYVRHIRN